MSQSTAETVAGRPASLGLDLDVMNEGHLDAVLEIEKTVFSNPWQRNDFRNAMSRSGSLCLVPLVNGGMIGYSVGFFVSDMFHLADFAIHPDYQNRGIGRLFLKRLLDLVKERAAGVVSLEVRVSNLSAISLYRKAGFQTVAIRKGYYSRPREDAFIMVKALCGMLSGWLATHFLSNS